MKRHSAAAERNRDPILGVLQRWLPPKGLVLEIAAGSGQHACWFARHLPELDWQPTDADPGALQSIAIWAAEAHAPNLRPPLPLDVQAADWPMAGADAIFCANMIHISPWESCLGLMAGAARVLSPGGVLVLYGPFRVDGVHTAPSNEAFDQDLQARDPRWGVRDLTQVGQVAAAQGLDHLDTIPMPANNLCVVWGKRQAP